ncbi:hypothetical protein D3C71_1304820 [compost metagenome]
MHLLHRLKLGEQILWTKFLLASQIEIKDHIKLTRSAVTLQHVHIFRADFTYHEHSAMRMNKPANFLDGIHNSILILIMYMLLLTRYFIHRVIRELIGHR